MVHVWAQVEGLEQIQQSPPKVFIFQWSYRINLHFPLVTAVLICVHWLYCLFRSEPIFWVGSFSETHKSDVGISKITEKAVPPKWNYWKTWGKLPCLKWITVNYRKAVLPKIMVMWEKMCCKKRITVNRRKAEQSKLIYHNCGNSCTAWNKLP